MYSRMKNKTQMEAFSQGSLYLLFEMTPEGTERFIGKLTDRGKDHFCPRETICQPLSAVRARTHSYSVYSVSGSQAESSAGRTGE